MCAQSLQVIATFADHPGWSRSSTISIRTPHILFSPTLLTGCWNNIPNLFLIITCQKLRNFAFWRWIRAVRGAPFSDHFQTFKKSKYLLSYDQNEFLLSNTIFFPSPALKEELQVEAVAASLEVWDNTGDTDHITDLCGIKYGIMWTKFSC